MGFALQLMEQNNRSVIEYSGEVKKNIQRWVHLHLESSALNRRDDWICKGAYPNIQSHVTLGSDGFGTIVDMDDCDRNPLSQGDPIIICPSMEWGEGEDYPSKGFHILGMPSHGTFASELIVPVENVFSAPKHLNYLEASALPLAGLTAYRAVITKGQVRSGDRVLISGVGGGVAVFALQFSLALGAEVYVTSGSQYKIDKAIEMGAKGGVLYTEDSWYKSLPKGFDVIVDSAGGDDFGGFISLIGMGGRIVFFGGTNGSWPKIKPQHLFFKQASILATTMGSPREFQAMCDLIDRHKIVPVIDSVYSIHDHEKAFERLLNKNRFGKVVFDHKIT